MQDARVIHLNGIYPLEDFKKISGLGDFALRTARQNGLNVLRANGKAYVYGGDFLAYLKVIGGENVIGTDGASADDGASLRVLRDTDRAC